MNIVVALDGSEYSIVALETVLARSWPADCRIRLLHVEGRDNDVLSSVLRAFRFKGTSPSNRFTDLQSMLSSIAEDCERSSGISVKPEILSGDPVEVILRFSKNFGANLIVTGTRSNKGLEAMLLGSVSQSLLEQAFCPLLICRNLERQNYESKKILLCIDDSASSAAAVEWLAGQTWISTAEICLLSIIEPAPYIGAASHIHDAGSSLLKWQAERLFVDKLAQEWAKFICQRNPPANVYAGVAEGQPAEIILKAAANWPADLVVMGSHGKSGLAKIVLGSVSEKIARDAQCSVEVIKGIESSHYQELREKVEADSSVNELLNKSLSSRRHEQAIDNDSTINVIPPSMMG